MKLLLVLLFAFTFPIVIFLTTILYGGVSPTIIKEELSHANIYSKITSYFSEATHNEESEHSELDGIIGTYFTPDYTQTKVEEVIDESFGWVTGKTEVVPAVAFPEIKQKLMTSNPDLLTELQSMAETTDQPMDTTGMSDEEIAQSEMMNQQMQEQMAMFSTFAKNDFSLPLESHLKGVKQMYSTLKIIQPVLLVIMILELLLLAYLCKSWSSRLKWLGGALLFSGIVGFGAIAFQKGLIALLTAIAENAANDVTSLFAPILIAVIEYFVRTYTNYQGIISIVLLILSAVCFVVASLQKSNPQPAIKPATVKKKKK